MDIFGLLPLTVGFLNAFFSFFTPPSESSSSESANRIVFFGWIFLPANSSFGLAAGGGGNPPFFFLSPPIGGRAGSFGFASSFYPPALISPPANIEANPFDIFCGSFVGSLAADYNLCVGLKSPSSSSESSKAIVFFFGSYFLTSIAT